jgi:hypothetical protein
MKKYKIISTLLLLQAIVVTSGGFLNFFWRFFLKHTGNLKPNIQKIAEMAKINSRRKIKK